MKNLVLMSFTFIMLSACSGNPIKVYENRGDPSRAYVTVENFKRFSIGDTSEQVLALFGQALPSPATLEHWNTTLNTFRTSIPTEATVMWSYRHDRVFQQRGVGQWQDMTQLVFLFDKGGKIVDLGYRYTNTKPSD